MPAGLAHPLVPAPALPDRARATARTSKSMTAQAAQPKPRAKQGHDPDADLMARYANGDARAAAELLDSLSGRLYALAIRLLNDGAEAEDVVQETMLRVWKIAPEWRKGEAKVATWAYGVARNLCLDRLRKRRSTGLDEAPEQVDESPLPLEGMIAQDRAEALRHALERLPERQRTAIVLRHFEEASNPEIAETIGTSVEAVESLLARGRRKLAALLAPMMERI